MAQRRRGKYIMMPYKTLKERFGNSLAKQMLQEKKQQEEGKDASDPLTYWMKHPDVDHEASTRSTDWLFAWEVPHIKWLIIYIQYESFKTNLSSLDL